MFAFTNPRQRSHSQSFSQPAPYRPQEYYLPNPVPEPLSLGPSGATSRTITGDHSRHDLYPQPNDHFYHHARHNESIGYSGRDHFSQPATFNQSYDRRGTSPSELHLVPNVSYHGHHRPDTLRSNFSNMTQFKRNGISNLLDNFSLSPSHSGFAPEPVSGVGGPSSEHSGDSDFWPLNTPEIPSSDPPKARKARREKPRIELAADQPPTTQGKPRARVYVACLQCRARKIRCDGAKPVCHNCGRRANDSNECNYDPIPKRRGPDKTPGARQRMTRDVRNEIDDGLPSRRRRRTRDSSTSNSKQTNRKQLPTRGRSTTDSPQNRSLRSDTNVTIPLTLSPGSPGNISCDTSDFVPPNYSRSSYSPCGCHGLTQCPDLLGIEGLTDPRKPVSVITTYHDAFAMSAMIPPYGTSRGHVIEIDENGNEREDSRTPDIASEPSLTFTRKVWWDSLLSLYLSTDCTRPQTLTISQRESAAQGITSDLCFIFRASHYWFSFFHIPSFFSNFFDLAKRERIQPSLVLALLAMATFWQSSEVGYGKQGRERALRFRDEAQGAMDASFNSGWIDETLAQTAWLLALFEVCAHPRHSSERSTSAMVMLDSIIRSLALTSVDADDPDASVFSPGAVPIVNSSKPREVWSPEAVAHSSSDASAHHNSASQCSAEAGCSCHSITLGEHWPSTPDHAPMWCSTPAWDKSWSEGEIRKESCRRLCWSSMMLAAGHISYTTAHRSQGLDLFISDPANYVLLFSGESVARSPAPSRYSSKDTVWALHDRSFLLWHGCIRKRSSSIATDEDKAHFALKAWLEADSLEHALNRHTCAIERAFLFQAREYIFNTRMCISYEFRRYIPLVTANMNGLFHRRKAEEWLTHQVTVGEGFMRGLHTVTGNSNNLLARRPFFVFWFMGQIHRALALYQCDDTLNVALDVCKALIPAIDYLTALWPCPEQRYRYETLREKVAHACLAGGIEPPPPIDLSLPPPSLVAFV